MARKSIIGGANEPLSGLLGVVVEPKAKAHALVPRLAVCMLLQAG
jgi:hypothetical protein